jgi:phosphodiesterase/alkaline phosphatase D-like protein
LLAGGLVLAAAPALAAAPEVKGESVPSVTPFEARLEAIVNAGEEPAGKTTECHFQYGETSVAEHEKECEQGNALEGGEQGVSLNVTGLAAKTLYHYRVVVKNATGEAKGVEAGFTTKTLEPPIVESESFSELTSTGAKLEATVNPSYQETTCKFEYSTKALLPPGETTTEPCPAPLGTGGGGVGASVVLTGLELGTTYYYRVIAENATPPTKDGAIQSFATLAKPLVTPEETHSITRVTATVSAKINPEGSSTTYHIDYGETSAYDEHTAEVQAGTGFGEETIQAGLAGLTPDTTYHYAVVVTNQAGTVMSPDETFTTVPPTPPTAATGGASNITLTTATVSGTIGPEGLGTSYELDLGADTTYGTSIYGEAGSGTEPIGISVSLQYLAPGATYHYRIVAINSDGKIYGADETFTTPAYSAPIVQPFTLPLLQTSAIAFPVETKGSTTTTPRVLTKAQKLVAALKACHKKAKGKRAACEATARKRYGPVKRTKKK